MQTQCPICEEFIPCDKGDIGKSRRCPVCEIDFVTVVIPTVDDVKRREERRALLVNYVVPLASTLLLFGSLAGAFWQRISIQNDAEAALAQRQAEQFEKNRLQTEEMEKQKAERAAKWAEANRIAEAERSAEAERPAATNAVAENQPSPAVPTPPPVTEARNGAEMPPANVEKADSNAPRVIVPSRTLDLTGLPHPSSNKKDQTGKFERTNIFVSQDQNTSLTRSASGKGTLRVSGSNQEFDLPEFQTPVTLFPVEKGRGGFIAVGDDGLLTILDPQGNKKETVRITDRPIVDCVWAADSQVIFATEDGPAGIFNFYGQTLVEQTFAAPIRRVCPAPIGNGYVTGGADRQIHWFNGPEFPETSFLADIPIEFIAANRPIIGGDYLVAVAGGGMVEVLSMQANGVVFKRSMGGLTVSDIAFGADKTLNVATRDGALFVFSLPDGELLDLVTVQGTPAKITNAGGADLLAVWTEEIIEAGGKPLTVMTRKVVDAGILTAATDASASFPEIGDPEIRLLEFQAKSLPLAIESLSTDKESKTLTVRGRGFSGIEEITVLRPGESSVRLKATAVSDGELTAPWSPRISGGIPVVQSGGRIAVPVPWQMRRVIQTSAEPAAIDASANAAKNENEGEGEEEKAIPEVAPDVSGVRFLKGKQKLAVVPEDCTFLLVTDSAAVTEAIHGKVVVIYQTAAELPEEISDDVRLILQTPASGDRKSRGKSTTLAAEDVFSCPVRDGIPLP